MATDLSKNSFDQVLDLIKETNELNSAALTANDVEFIDLVPLTDDPSGKNSGLTVSSLPNSRYVGDVPVKYNRLVMEGLLQYGALTIEIQEEGSEADILTALNTAYGTNLSFDDVELSDIEAVDYDGDVITITAKATSLAWNGALDLIVKWNQTALSSILVNQNLNGLKWPGISDSLAPSVWSALPRYLGLPQLATYSSIATDKNGVWVAVGFAGAAARSIDNGVTWTALPTGLNSGGGSANISAVDTDEKGVWVAVGDAGYGARSTDNGATWSAMPRGLGSGQQSIATDGNGVWFITGNQHRRSLDNGLTWSGLTANLPSSSPNNRVRTNKNGTWIITTSESQPSFVGIYRSTTINATGFTFVNSKLNTGQPSNIAVSVFHIHGDIWLATSGAYSAISKNKGVTWTMLGTLGDALNSGGVTGVISVTSDDEGNVIAVRSGGWASKSLDFGDTWEEMPRTLNHGGAAATVHPISSATDKAGKWIVTWGGGYVTEGLPE